MADIKSIFAQKCERFGFNPDETSIVKLAAAQRGIFDREVSQFELACIDYGLDHEKTSYTQLASARLGSKEELSMSEIEKRMGKNWTHEACKFSW